MIHKNFAIYKNREFDIFGFEDIEKFKDFKSVLIQVFSSEEDRVFVKSILRKIKKVLPNANIIGSACDSYMIENRIEKDGVLFSILGFEKSDVDIYYYPIEIDNSFKVGKDIAKKIEKDAKLLIVFSDSESINGDRFLEGIKSINSDLRVVGGIASTKSWKDTFVIFDTDIKESGVVFAKIFGENLSFYANYLLNWEAFGKEFTVTKAKDKNLISIDNRSPKEILEHYLGKEVADDIPGRGSAFSFIIKRENEFLPRGIIGKQDDAMVLAGEVKSGDKIYLGYANPLSLSQHNKLIDDIFENIKEPEVIFNYYCLGRKLYLPKEIVKYEIDILNSLSSFSGFFTLGEFFSADSKFLNLNFSSTILAMSEKDEKNCKEKDLKTKIKSIEKPEIKTFSLITQGLFNMVKARSQELEMMAYYDQLTTLPNRRYLNEKIDLEIKEAKKSGKKFAIFYIDLDKFKHINDTLGHIYGDEILKELSQKLYIIKTEEIFISRFGGDEFILLLKNSNLKKITNLARKIIDICKSPIIIEDKRFSLGASIGVSIYPDDGLNSQDLIKNADIAMYQAKRKGGNRYRFYNKIMTKKAMNIINLENDLLEAIKKDEFIVYYQPIYNILTKEIIGAEALIRWNHPKKGILYPEDFIEFAERYGYIDKITEKVLEKVFYDLNKLKNRGKKIDKININFSVKNIINRKFIEKIANLSKRYSISPKTISIEITETSLIKNLDRCLDSLKRLKELDIEISIDDFGTGYSSLNYLKSLPISSLKIDKSFIDEIPYEKSDVVIVETILALADALGIKVIVEGIETKEQEDFLIKSKNYFGQGFLYKEPMGFEEFKDIL